MDEGDLFRSIRKGLDLDQESFGALLGKGQSWVTKLERGKNEAAKQFLEIFRILVLEHGVNPNYFLSGEAEMFLKAEPEVGIPEDALTIEERLARIEKSMGLSSPGQQ